MKRKEEIKSKALEYAMFPTNSYSETARISFEQGAKWADENPDGKMLLHVLNKGVKQGKREMLDKACEWLSKVPIEDMEYKYEDFDTSEGWYKFIEDFRKAMEE